MNECNTVTQEALELLSENAELGENEGRSVAFRRAAAILKTLPQAVQRMEDLQGLPCLGDHLLRVIKVRCYSSVPQKSVSLLEKYFNYTDTYITFAL